MLPALVYIMLYRLERQMREETFDETMLERVLCDFIAYHPQDCEFSKYFLSVVKGEENLIINRYKDEYCITILLLYKLREKKTSQWFVAIQRLFVQLYEYNKSNYCGQYLGRVATTMLEFLITTRASDFDIERKDKVMGNLNRQTWNELWNSPEAEKVRRKVRCCDRNCWMIGSVSPAMHKYITTPLFWVAKHKLKSLFGLKYSMYENPICCQLRDGKVTKEDLDKLSTCDLSAIVSDGLSEVSKEALKGKRGEDVVNADVMEQGYEATVAEAKSDIEIK